MSKTATKLPPIVQMYDFYRDREYYTKHHGFIFTYTELVRVDRLENHLTLNMECDKMPDEVWFNGKSYQLVEK